MHVASLVAVSFLQTAGTVRVSGSPAARGAADPLLEAARAALGNEVIEDVTAGTLPRWRFPAPREAPVERRETWSLWAKIVVASIPVAVIRESASSLG